MCRPETATVDQKVEAVQTTVEENQKRIKEHDERLTTLGSLISENQNEIKGMDSKIEDVKKSIQGTLVDKAVLSNDQAKFNFDSAELSPETKAAVDQFVQKLVADNRGVYLEIRGYTDNVGPRRVQPDPEQETGDGRDGVFLQAVPHPALQDAGHGHGECRPGR